MSELPSPTASRLARARWLDARLLVGLLLVLLSVVLGARVLAAADDRVQVWSVTRDLAAGSVLGGDDLRVASVRLDGVATRYLAAAEDLEGLELARPVGRGELVPASAVRAVGSAELRRLVIEVDRVGVAGLAKGQVVDLYSVADAGSDAGTGPPELVLEGVTVAEDVRSGDGAFGGGGSTAGVALLVDRANVPAVLQAVARSAVYVVQVPPGAGSP